MREVCQHHSAGRVPRRARLPRSPKAPVLGGLRGPHGMHHLLYSENMQETLRAAAAARCWQARSPVLGGRKCMVRMARSAAAATKRTGDPARRGRSTHSACWITGFVHPGCAVQTRPCWADCVVRMACTNCSLSHAFSTSCSSAGACSSACTCRRAASDSCACRRPRASDPGAFAGSSTSG